MVRQAAASFASSISSCSVSTNCSTFTPEPGDWFCEFEVDYAPDREVRDGDLVRYEGKGERSTLDGDTWVTVMRDMVWPEGADECREPGGLVLIRQS